MSCGSEYNVTTCECTTAAILMSQGLLACPEDNDGPYCPNDCEICDTCLTLLGCSQTTRPGDPLSKKFNFSLLAYILAAVAGILLGIIAVMVHSKKEEKPLEENLVNGAVPPSGGGGDNVWRAPVS